MTWRVASADGSRWVQYDGDDWTADPDATLYIQQAAGQRMPVVPLGETYASTSDGDPLWLYLAARQAVPTPHTVTGDPPRLPEPAGQYPDGAVF